MERGYFGIDKPSDALCNLCFRPFNFTIIFHDDKKYENKVIGNARIHVNSHELNNIQFYQALS